MQNTAMLVPEIIDLELLTVEKRSAKRDYRSPRVSNAYERASQPQIRKSSVRMHV
jgi:hypothetical protein